MFVADIDFTERCIVYLDYLTQKNENLIYEKKDEKPKNPEKNSDVKPLYKGK